MSGKPSPTPWSVQARLTPSENHRGYGIYSANGWRIADVMPIDEDGIQGEANAHLMKAAPELCDALEEVIDWNERNGALPVRLRDALKRVLALVRIHERQGNSAESESSEL